MVIYPVVFLFSCQSKLRNVLKEANQIVLMNINVLDCIPS